MPDKSTTRWTRDASDELAIRNGCKFDEERGQFVVDWIQGYCRLYEGDAAGEQMIFADWQYDVTMRLFGWIRKSAKWGRWVRRFRQASIWIPKKSGKSPTLAAWGLYLLAGDGEQGQKVFLAAKDGTQAREIAGKHAIEMTRLSPVLDAACSINRATMRITHEQSRSIMQPLSSANSRTQQSKEGLNGSVLIDECFTKNTEILTPKGSIPIYKVRPGDIIYHGAGEGIVLGTIRRFASEIYRLEYSNGIAIECTASHPIFTGRGWVKAGELAVGEVAFRREDMQALWAKVPSTPLEKQSGKDIRTDGEVVGGAGVLLDILREEISQPDGERIDAKESLGNASTHWTQAANSGRQRASAVGFTSGIAQSPWSRMGARIGYTNRSSKKKPDASDLLQGGYRERVDENSDRSRWIVAQHVPREGEGCEEDGDVEQPRLVRISRIKFSRPVAVYNLHVSGHPSYFANGILAHNCHVVDREFVNRISRAGISRSEPLHIEVSTAGNNPDGYGKERFDYAQDVVRGSILDDELLVAIYAAPQTMTDAELAADPLKYCTLANPTLGRIVDSVEILNDYERSKTSIDKLADFKMYRLNIWQRAANPWLSQDVWQACKSDHCDDSCEGLDCWAGLDLSLTNDMTAFALAFKDGDIIRLLNWFWLPEETVAENRDKASYREWEKSGVLRVIPGATIDHNYLLPELIELVEQFKPNELAFDKMFAQQLTTDLANETGVSLVEFAQTPKYFTQPSGDFERLLLERRLLHDGNPILSWQAGHVCLDKNAKTGLCKPIKPQTGGRHLTVDGIQASVTAVSRAVASDIGTAYDSAGSGAILL